MKKFFRITLQIIAEFINAITYWFKCNIRGIAVLIEVALPYVMYYLGQSREYGIVGGEIFIPICVLILAKYIKKYTNKIGKGTMIPRPPKRFVHFGEDDEIYILRAEQEEMLMYLADLEDWFDRKGCYK